MPGLLQVASFSPVRYPLGTRTRLFVGSFFLGSAALLFLLPLPDESQRQVALAAAVLGVLPLVLPSHASCDGQGISLMLLGLPAGRFRWQEIRAVVTSRAPFRRVHVTQVHGRGGPKMVIPAELVGYRALLGELARRRPDALDGTSAAIARGEERVATLERLALPLLLLEFAAFAYVASRFAGAL